MRVRRQPLLAEADEIGQDEIDDGAELAAEEALRHERHLEDLLVMAGLLCVTPDGGAC